MRGTEKQIAYANDLIAKMDTELTAIVEMAPEAQKPMWEEIYPNHAGCLRRRCDRAPLPEKRIRNTLLQGLIWERNDRRGTIGE